MGDSVTNDDRGQKDESLIEDNAGLPATVINGRVKRKGEPKAQKGSPLPPITKPQKEVTHLKATKKGQH